MLVVWGRFFHEGRQLRRGEPVPRFENVPPHIRKIHLQSGALRDVPEAEAKRMYQESLKAERRDERMRIERKAKRAEAEAQSVAAQCKELAAKLKGLQKAAKDAEDNAARMAAELEAFDAAHPEPVEAPDYYEEVRAEPVKAEKAPEPEIDMPSAEEVEASIRAEAAKKLREELREKSLKDLRAMAEDYGLLIPRGIKKAEVAECVAEAIEAEQAKAESGD